ncbi:nam9 protein [Coprinopsis sp. MPI-PUGE-AT-0042]|nr:nam9 protein [Coprinopsis sp. MPI-PUGE-AT-0042]
MRDRGVFSMRRAFPRMSWSPKNLYNLYRRTAGPRADDLRFPLVPSPKPYPTCVLPDSLRHQAVGLGAGTGDDKGVLEEYARRKNRETKFNEEIEEKGMAPVGSLMFAEVERRIDVFIFRCCFAHSVYEARRLVIHGDVYLNGKKHTNANTRLAPGDMVSVNPDAIRFFKNLPGEHDDIIARLVDPPTKAQKAEAAKLKAAESQAVESDAAEAESTTASETATEEPASEESSSEAPQPTEEPAVATPSRYTPFKLPYYAPPPTYSSPRYSEIPTPYDADGALVRYAWEWYVQRRPRVRSQRALGATKEERDVRKKAIVEEGRKKRTVDTERVRKVLKSSGRKVKAV